MQTQTKVLALKYRPKRFEDLVGQSTISQTLSLALDSNRLSHAYLFSGLRGSGKTSTARIMAKALLCEKGPTSKPCEVCDHCVSANENSHLDIVEMDAASNRGIDDIKDLIEHTKYKPSSARFKVFIIDEVHMLTTQAFNALLKTLEEPPGFVKFILATTDALKLPATILSRTQHFRFKKISNKDVIHHLSHILNEEEIEFESECLDIISRSGQGSLRDTLTLLDQAIIFSKGKITRTCVVDMLGLIDPSFMEYVFDIVLNKKDINEVIHKLEEYEASSVCDEMAIYLKDKMLSRDPRFDILLFDRFFRVLADAKQLLALNSDSSFVLLLSLLKMQEATNIRSIDEIINQVQNVDVSQPLTEAIDKDVVLKHAIEDKKKIYEDIEVKSIEPKVDELKANISECKVEKIEEKVENVEVLESRVSYDNSNDLPLNDEIKQEIISDIISSNIETISYPNPFDEGVSLNTLVEPIIQEEKIVNTSNIIEQTKSLEDFLTSNEIKDVKLNVNQAEEVQKETKEEKNDSLTEEIKEDQDKTKFELVINQVYNRDHQLGEAFEDNFIYKKFENSTLFISSFAQGDERKLLFKHYAILKSFMYDVYGNEIEIEFVKEEPKVLQKKNDELNPNETNTVASMIEDVVLPKDEEFGSGCVADMHKTANANPSQQELQINDILNSTMLTKAKELFEVKKITVKPKT